jgi:hypothetical protein
VLEEGAVAVRVSLPGPDVAARLRVLSDVDGQMTLAAHGVRVGGLPVPDVLAGFILRQFNPGPRLRERLRLEATVAPVTITPQALRIGAP